jgi:hypothetical protein
MQTKKRSIIDVTFELNGAPETLANKYLREAARHLADNGLFTGDSEMTVEEWSFDIQDKP